MTSEQRTAAADLTEQLQFETSHDSLSGLQAVMWGIRMNLHCLVINADDRDTLLAGQGGWKKAFVTSKKNKAELRRGIASVSHAVQSDAALMRHIKRLAKPVLAERHVLAKADAKEALRLKAAFQARLRNRW